MTLEHEAAEATRLLVGLTVTVVRRHRPGEVVVEFSDGSRLVIDGKPDGLELSITGTDRD